MHYTDIENYQLEDEAVINWRVRHGKVQLLCPKCQRFFLLPKDIKIDDNGYCSDSFYHMCQERMIDGELYEDGDGWTALVHLVDWGVK